MSCLADLTCQRINSFSKIDLTFKSIPISDKVRRIIRPRKVAVVSQAKRTFKVEESKVMNKKGENIDVKLRKNPLVNSTCNRMYLNKDKTWDIKFKVGYDEISAHKCVLAALSPKYEAQFYGEFDDTKSNVVKVEEVSAAAFNEFLQFFYLDSIKLTHENIEDVMSLVAGSLVEEFFEECINFLTETLSADNLCQSYYLAMKHECEDFSECCERKISLHSDEVFTSKGFICSGREVVFNILQLESLNCKETDVFNACIKWAKNFCAQNEYDENDKQKLREALVDKATPPVNLLYQIRFGAMSIEEFMLCYKSNKDIFTEDEREEIFYMIGKVNDSKPKFFNDELRGIPYKKWDDTKKIECNRIFSESSTANFHFGVHRIAFSCNRPTLLGGFYCGSLWENPNSSCEEKIVSAKVTIVRKHNPKEADGKIMFSGVEQLVFGTKQEASVRIQRPIVTKPNFTYEIQIELKEGVSVKNYEFKKEVILNLGLTPCTIVKFHDERQTPQGLVTRLIFNLCDDKTSNEDVSEAKPIV